MNTIPDDVAAILDGPVFVHLATTNPDGSPQVSMIWVDRDGDLVRFGTAEGRAKTRNLRNDPRVALSFSPGDDPYRNVTMRGRVTSIEANGTGLIDRMAQKYLGEDRFSGITPGQVRLDVTVQIATVTG